MKQVTLLQDIFDNWYLVPSNKEKEFEDGRLKNDLKFKEKFYKYGIGTNPNLYQLYVSEADMLNLTR